MVKKEADRLKELKREIPQKILFVEGMDPLIAESVLRRRLSYLLTGKSLEKEAFSRLKETLSLTKSLTGDEIWISSKYIRTRCRSVRDEEGYVDHFSTGILPYELRISSVGRKLIEVNPKLMEKFITGSLSLRYLDCGYYGVAGKTELFDGENGELNVAVKYFKGTDDVDGLEQFEVMRILEEKAGIKVASPLIAEQNCLMTILETGPLVESFSDYSDKESLLRRSFDGFIDRLKSLRKQWIEEEIWDESIWISRNPRDYIVREMTKEGEIKEFVVIDPVTRHPH